MSQTLRTAWSCSTDTESLVLGDASSLRYSWDLTSHILSALVEAVNSGCYSYMFLLKPRAISGKIPAPPLFQPCLGFARACRQRAESAHICTARTSLSRNTRGFPISFLRCVTWLALSLTLRVFLQSRLPSWCFWRCSGCLGTEQMQSV